MKKKPSPSPRSKSEALRKMLNKEVKVVSDNEWSGLVIGVIDEENLLVLRNGEKIPVNIFDVRSK